MNLYLSFIINDSVFIFVITFLPLFEALQIFFSLTVGFKKEQSEQQFILMRHYFTIIVVIH